METETQLFEGYEPPPTVEPPADPFTLGRAVAFSHTLQRRTTHRHDETNPGRLGSRQRWKVWVPEHAPYGTYGGLIVGRRTLANGRAEHEWEAGTQWYPGTAQHFRAYLVAWHLDKRPVLVLPEHLTLQ